MDFGDVCQLLSARRCCTGARLGRVARRPPQGAVATGSRCFRRLATGGVSAMAQVALTIDGLGVDFGGFKAVNNVSLTIEEGELRVLLRAHCGRETTLIDLVSGKTQRNEGLGFPAYNPKPQLVY